MNWIKRISEYLNRRNLQKEKVDISAALIYVFNNLKKKL